jgi:hypothetical protein
MHLIQGYCSQLIETVVMFLELCTSSNTRNLVLMGRQFTSLMTDLVSDRATSSAL